MLKPSLILTAAEIWLRLLFLSVYSNPTSENGDEFFIQIPAACLPSTFIWNDLGLWHLSYFLNWPWLLPKIFCRVTPICWNLKTLLKVDSWRYWTHVQKSIESPFLWPSQTQIGSGCQFLCKSSVLLQKWRRSCFQIKPDSPTRGTKITGMCLPFENLKLSRLYMAKYSLH